MILSTVWKTKGAKDVTMGHWVHRWQWTVPNELSSGQSWDKWRGSRDPVICTVVCAPEPGSPSSLPWWPCLMDILGEWSMYIPPFDGALLSFVLTMPFSGNTLSWWSWTNGWWTLCRCTTPLWGRTPPTASKLRPPAPLVPPLTPPCLHPWWEPPPLRWDRFVCLVFLTLWLTFFLFEFWFMYVHCVSVCVWKREIESNYGCVIQENCGKSPEDCWVSFALCVMLNVTWIEVSEQRIHSLNVCEWMQACVSV